MWCDVVVQLIGHKTLTRFVRNDRPMESGAGLDEKTLDSSPPSTAVATDICPALVNPNLPTFTGYYLLYRDILNSMKNTIRYRTNDEPTMFTGDLQCPPGDLSVPFPTLPLPRSPWSLRHAPSPPIQTAQLRGMHIAKTPQAPEFSAGYPTPVVPQTSSSAAKVSGGSLPPPFYSPHPPPPSSSPPTAPSPPSQTSLSHNAFRAKSASSRSPTAKTPASRSCASTPATWSDLLILGPTQSNRLSPRARRATSVDHRSESMGREEVISRPFEAVAWAGG